MTTNGSLRRPNPERRNQHVDQNLQQRVFVSISHRIIINCGLDSARLVDDHDRMIHWITLTESGCLLIDLVQRKEWEIWLTSIAQERGDEESRDSPQPWFALSCDCKAELLWK